MRGRWRQFENGPTTAGSDPPVDSGAIEITVPVKNDSGKGARTVVATGEYIQNRLGPFSAGDRWRA